MMSSVKWKDEVHEEEGGCDHIGIRPQDGRALLKEEMRAYDDVTGANLDPRWVEEHRHAAWEQIRRDKPLFVIGSSPMHNVLPAPDDEPGDQGQVPRGNAEVPACNG